MADRTVESEFGANYDIPGFLLFLVKEHYLDDMSWHNEVSPSFGIDGVMKGTRDNPQGYSTMETRIWVEHPIQRSREFQGKRFMVTHSSSSGDDHEDWDFDELEGALKKLFEVITEHFDEMEAVPGVWSMLLDDAGEDDGEALEILLKKYYHWK